MNYWQEANLDLIAKSISELSYEEILAPKEIENNYYELVLSSNVKYTFKATKSIWGMLRVESHSISKSEETDLLASIFFRDAQKELALTDIILSNFIEEMNNSLYSDVYLLELQNTITSEELIKLNGEDLQKYLKGHPKLLVTKGRLGWGSDEIEKYSPERNTPIKLHWLAIKKEKANYSIDRNYNSQLDLIKECIDDSEIAAFQSCARANGVSDEYIYCPVHPWQWQRFIKIQFQNEIFNKEIIYLGEWGDEYLPQISLRTFYNISRISKCDIKLPISVLNTSAIRGIAAKYVDIGNSLSHYLNNLFSKDEILKDVEVLFERGQVAFEQPEFKKIPGSPYRYKEYLGALWRDSHSSKIENINQKVIMTGALFHQDKDGKSYINLLVNNSSLTMEEWITKYFQVVVIPLYHLQVKYGVGLVSHGQNIVLKLENNIPKGLIIKDFQGDLRLSVNSVLLTDDVSQKIANKLEVLPVNYLIHDLITGHFVTVLRFISSALELDNGFNEMKFYGLGAKVLRSYIDQNNVSEELNLLSDTFVKVLVNKVRFYAGYADSDQRLKPMVGSNIENPFNVGLKYLEAQNE